MRFLTDRIGQGPFMRVDVGYTQEEAQVQGIRTASDWGGGITAGGRVRHSSDEWDAGASERQLRPSVHRG